VDTYPISYCVAPRFPAICSLAAFTMVVSITSIIAAVMSPPIGGLPQQQKPATWAGFAVSLRVLRPPCYVVTAVLHRRATTPKAARPKSISALVPGSGTKVEMSALTWVVLLLVSPPHTTKSMYSSC
jgi:hypothetical protein